MQILNYKTDLTEIKAQKLDMLELHFIKSNDYYIQHLL